MLHPQASLAVEYVRVVAVLRKLDLFTHILDVGVKEYGTSTNLVNLLRLLFCNFVQRKEHDRCGILPKNRNGLPNQTFPKASNENNIGGFVDELPNATLEATHSLLMIGWVMIGWVRGNGLA